MLLSQMPHHRLNHGVFTRADKQEFQIDSVLYESPPEYDHWLAHFTVTHACWPPIAYKAIIPKSIASTIPFAQALLLGPIADQVRSNQLQATAQGRDYAWIPSIDGWQLLG